MADLLLTGVSTQDPQALLAENGDELLTENGQILEIG